MRVRGIEGTGKDGRILMKKDICGLCGKSGANKIPHPIHWPGEEIPETELVHWECEENEYERAFLSLTHKERERFLKTL